MRPREKFIFLLSIFLTRSRLSSMPETVKLEFTDKCINQFPIGFICYIGFYYLLIVVRLLSSSEWINFSLFYLTNIFFFYFSTWKKDFAFAGRKNKPVWSWCWEQNRTIVATTVSGNKDEDNGNEEKQVYWGNHTTPQSVESSIQWRDV